MLNSFFQYLNSQKRFILVILILIVFRSSLADQYIVPSGSMLPTIQIGDRIFVNKMAYDLQIPFTDYTIVKLDEPKRGDIVVFKHPESGITMVKRLIGLPGDEIELEESSPLSLQMGQTHVIVPEDHYFMMGDNRGNSSDSRVWGFVPRKNLLGKAKSVLFSGKFLSLNPKVDWGRFGKNLYDKN